MAQIQTQTSGIANLDLASLATRIQNIRNRLSSSLDIRSADLQDIISVYNDWINHAHTVSDYVYLAFGGAPIAVTTTTSDWTSSAKDSVGFASISNNAGIYSGADCAASVTAQIVRMVNSLRSHQHKIKDKSTDYGDWAYKWSYCIQTAAAANSGLPSTYNSGTDGVPIWPAGGGVNYNGWVHEYFYPSTSTVQLKFACDNSFTVYINGSAVLSGSDWHTWYITTVSVNPGQQNEITVNVVDYGQGYGFAGNITDSNGNIILKTNTGWTSR